MTQSRRFRILMITPDFETARILGRLGEELGAEVRPAKAPSDGATPDWDAVFVDETRFGIPLGSLPEIKTVGSGISVLWLTTHLFSLPLPTFAP